MQKDDIASLVWILRAHPVLARPSAELGDAPSTAWQSWERLVVEEGVQHP